MPPNPLLILLVLLCTAVTTLAAETDFYRDIYPFLKTNCISCHNKTTTKAGLNMESPELMKKGGETGAGLIPGKGADSLVVQAALHTEDLVMPPKNNKTGAVNLTPTEIALLKTWINQGAKSSIKQARQVVWQPLPAGVNPIYTVSMTKDGRLAACGRANQVFIYDLATRQFATRLVDDQSGVAHRALVQSLAFSPDGMRLASGSFREVKIWRQEKAKAATRKADAALGAVISVISGDGKQLVSADKKGVLQVLDAASGKALKTIPNVNASGIRLMSLSPDASKIAVYGNNAAFSLWKLTDGSKLAAKAGLTGVYAVAWTTDGNAIATAGEDKIVRVWSMPVAGSLELAAPKELKGAIGAIKSLVAGSTPDRLVTAGEDSKVRLWSIAEAKIVREIAGIGALSLAVSHDGKQLATGCADGVVRVFDLETAKQLVELRGDLASNKLMASLDWTIAAQGLDQAFQAKEVARIEAENKAVDELLKKANETIATVKKELPEKQKAAKPTTEARLAAQKAADEVTALIAKAPEGKPDATLEKQNKEAQDKLMAATKAEGLALTSVAAVENHLKDADADVKRITAAKTKNDTAIKAANTAMSAAKKAQDKATADLAAGKLALTKSTSRPLAITFAADQQSVAAVFNDGMQRVWAITSGLPIEQATVSAETTSASITTTPDGTLVACAADGSIASVGMTSRWVLERVLGGEKPDSPFVDRVNAVRFSPDGKILAVGGGEPSRSGDISLFDVASGKLFKAWNERHSDAVLSLDFSPNGKLIASGAADKIARVTDIATGKQVNLFEGHTHHVMGVAFRADGRILATAGGDGVVLVWDMLIGERKKKIEGWTKEVTSLQFIGATSQIVTSAGDNLVRIVNDDGTEVRAIAKLPDFMQSAASNASASTVIGGGEDSLLRVWDGSGKELAAFGAK